jgi:acyl carrier protein
MTNAITDAEIGALIKQVLHERFDIAPDKVNDDTTTREVGLDSILLMDVVLDLEDRLGVQLQDLSLPPNPTLLDVVALVRRNLETGS